MFSENNLAVDSEGDPTLYYIYKYNKNGYPTERKPSSGNQDESYQYF